MISLPRREFATMPSVSMWNTDMGIQRDPPRCVQTRIKEYATDTNDVLNMVGDSGDRAVEHIRLFPRGVNPMVSVQYNNYSGAYGGQQASNPHKVMAQGAFRPPMFRLEDVLPLSRLPRLATSLVSNVEDPKSEYLIVNRDQYVSNPVYVHDDPLRVTVVDYPIVFPDVEFSPVVKYANQQTVDNVMHASAPHIMVPQVRFSIPVEYQGSDKGMSAHAFTDDSAPRVAAYMSPEYIHKGIGDRAQSEYNPAELMDVPQDEHVRGQAPQLHSKPLGYVRTQNQSMSGYGGGIQRNQAPSRGVGSSLSVSATTQAQREDHSERMVDSRSSKSTLQHARHIPVGASTVGRMGVEQRGNVSMNRPCIRTKLKTRIDGNPSGKSFAASGTQPAPMVSGGVKETLTKQKMVMAS